jgi:hypothetical protein
MEECVFVECVFWNWLLIDHEYTFSLVLLSSSVDISPFKRQILIHYRTPPYSVQKVGGGISERSAD